MTIESNTTPLKAFLNIFLHEVVVKIEYITNKIKTKNITDMNAVKKLNSLFLISMTPEA